MTTWPCCRTGDTASQDESRYWKILGRTSTDIIKSGGYKLSALQIEDVLLDHPDIAECAVVGIPDDDMGEVVTAIIACKSRQVAFLSPDVCPTIMRSLST